MDAFLWILLPVLVAAGSATLSIFMMQARMDVAVARERETLIRARSQLEAHEKALQDKIRAAEESAYRRAFEQFLMDFRVEERRFIRETKGHFLTRKSIIMQERLFFRNIPLSNWVEHETTLHDRAPAAVEAGPEASVFSARALGEHTKQAPKYLAQ